MGSQQQYNNNNKRNKNNNAKTKFYHFVHKMQNYVMLFSVMSISDYLYQMIGNV